MTVGCLPTFAHHGRQVSNARNPNLVTQQKVESLHPDTGVCIGCRQLGLAMCDDFCAFNLYTSIVFV